MSDDNLTSSAPKANPPAQQTSTVPKERPQSADPRLIPGGAHGSTHDIGMSAMDPDDVTVADETPE